MNSLGRVFRLTTAGESHGPAMVAIVDGVPAGLMLSEDDFVADMQRRRPGQSKYVTQRNEPDRVRILSGVFEGKTTGTSIALMIDNQDQRSRNYDDIKDKFRPGHADYTYLKKYGHRDYRGGGRASARETAMWVAAGVIAKKYLGQHGMHFTAAVTQIADVKAKTIDYQQALNNDFHFADLSQLASLEAVIDQLRRDGDSCGAEISALASGVPAGLGDPVFCKLDADLAKALMTINAVKAVAIGDGFDVVGQKGSENRDALRSEGFLSNHAGGILGGISSGQDIVARVAIKPTSSIRVIGSTLDVHGNETHISTTGRHDPCVGIRAPVIVEAMMAITVMDAFLLQKIHQE